ncbi:amino acid transporter [Annulohypoxylon moriforme]|nr:amino acid transporter [Annulohypoxylon moriforme]
MNNDLSLIEYRLGSHEDERFLNDEDQSPLGEPSSSVLPHVNSTPASPPRTLTFLNGLAILIGMQIGSGIFSAPATVISAVENRVTAAIAWLVAGILAWTGAASFIELGSLVPVNGGMLEYLIFLYSEEFGFIFAWSWILISRPCGLAMVSLVFSEYLHKALAGDEVANESPKTTAIAGIAIVTLLNCLGSNVGNSVAKAFMVVKIVGLLSIVLSGLVYWIFWPGASEPNPPIDVIRELAHNETENSPFTDTWANLDAFTNAVLAAVFAYGGWESISFVAGEIQNVKIILPRILHTSMIIVITLFITSNFALYSIVPLSKMENSNTVALDFGEQLFGTVGRVFYTWIVCLSCLGTLNAIVFSAGRLTQAAGVRRFVPSILDHNATPPLSRLEPHLPERLRTWGELHSRQNIPINAMLFNAAVACIFVMTGSFRQLLTFKGMMEYTIFLLTIFGLLVRNIRHRLWSPFAHAPAIFCILATVIIARAAFSHVITALFIAAFFLFLSLIYRRFWKQEGAFTISGYIQYILVSTTRHSSNARR